MGITEVVCFITAMGWNIAGFMIGTNRARRFPAPTESVKWHILWSWGWPVLLTLEGRRG